MRALALYLALVLGAIWTPVFLFTGILHWPLFWPLAEACIAMLALTAFIDSVGKFRFREHLFDMAPGMAIFLGLVFVVSR